MGRASVGSNGKEKAEAIEREREMEGGRMKR